LQNAKFESVNTLTSGWIIKFDSNAREVLKIKESRRGGMTACLLPKASPWTKPKAWADSGLYGQTLSNYNRRN